MSAFAPELKNHCQKVRRLYKNACRLIEAYYVGRPLVRYQCTLLRKKFDDNKCVTDPKEKRRLVWVGEYELFMKQYPGGFQKFQHSPGGTCYERVVTPPDWVMDYWHPLEKEMYPSYFDTRERRKCEYVDLWDKNILR